MCCLTWILTITEDLKATTNMWKTVANMTTTTGKMRKTAVANIPMYWILISTHHSTLLGIHTTKRNLTNS